MIKVELRPSEAVRTASAIATSIERMRDFCRETDTKYGDMNNIYRDAITDCKSAHKSIIAALRKEGWMMDGVDVEDDDIDRPI